MNFCLEARPTLLNNMFGLLLGFREQPIAVPADIEGMFMQIDIKEPDQNALGFLWTSKKGLKQYQYTRLIFGAECSPIIALNLTAKDFASQSNTKQLIRQSFYMDDFVHSFESIDITETSVLNMKTTLEKGGCNLTKFVSNEPEA